MFTLLQARNAINDASEFARGSSYAAGQKVYRLRLDEAGDEVKASGVVKGSSGYDEASFAMRDGKLLTASCTCRGFEKDGLPCRHVAALMVASLYDRERAAGEIPPDEDEQREALQRSAKDQYINQLIASGSARRMRGFFSEKKKVFLYPVIERRGNALALELRIGRTRPYVVHSLKAFSERVAQGIRMVYGKELVFGHSEEEVCAEDRALFRHLVMLGQQQDADMPVVEGAQLDELMRLFIGREVQLRGPEGSLQPMKVVEGDIYPALSLEEKPDGALLRVQAENVLLGSTGAYGLEASEIHCAFGSAFERVSGLLRIAQDCPDGLELEGSQLESVCAQVIAPAQAQTTVLKGRELLLKHTPLPMETIFYIDLGEKDSLHCRVSFDYGAQTAAPGEETPHICRDSLMEEAAVEAARSLFPQEVSPDEFAFSGNDEERFALLSERLNELETLGRVMIAERLAQTNVTTRRAMLVGISPSGTKLLVKADLGGLKQDELDEAYRAYRQRKKFVRLESGIFLSGEALEQAAEAAEMTQSLDLPAEELEKGAEVPLSRAMYLEQAVKEREGLKLSAPDTMKDFLERLEKAQHVEAEQPKTLKAQLRSYQKEGLSWLCALSDAGFSGILADDMGLGKTIQALSMLLREVEWGRPVRAMVVCPASLQLNWKGEAAKFAPSLKTVALTGNAKERAEKIADESTQLLITSYDQLRRDAQLYAGKTFTHMLLDEAQYIKNAASQAAKAVKTIKAAHKFAMTGTPIENRLSELWSIFDFLMPGYLHDYKKFKQRFEVPVVQEEDEKARKNLRLMIAPFILRRMKKDVLDDLPEKIETVMASEMTPEQRRVYRGCASRLLRAAKLGGAGQDKIRMLAGLTRLRQICCDPRLCLEGYAGGSGKLMQAMELIREMADEGHRMLLFSQFTSMLDILEGELKEAGIACLKLTGENDKEERMEMVKAFNEGDMPVFLISLKAGGTGLNLTGADVVIHYDPWWNTAAQNQATDRAYRIGQTKGVEVISLIAAGTIEERILLMQQEKRELSDGILMGEENLFTLDADTFKQILRG